MSNRGFKNTQQQLLCPVSLILAGCAASRVCTEVLQAEQGMLTEECTCGEPGKVGDIYHRDPEEQ